MFGSCKDHDWLFSAFMLAPVVLFATVLTLDIVSNFIVVLLGAGVVAYCLQMAYRNVSKKLVDKYALVCGCALISLCL